MTLVLNILWLVLGGGLVAAFGWLVAAMLIAITIIGLPWAPAALRIAGYSLMPFGQTVVDQTPGPLSFLGNVLWFVLAGWWLALAHLVLAVVLGCTIIGLPFAWAHLKLARLSLAPVGKAVVPAP